MTRFKGLLVRFLCLMWVTFVPLCLKSQSVKVSTSFDKESKIFRWELENMTDSVVRIHNGENWEGNYNIHYHLLDANGTGNQGYLFDIRREMAIIFIKEIIDRNPKLKEQQFIRDTLN